MVHLKLQSWTVSPAKRNCSTHRWWSSSFLVRLPPCVPPAAPLPVAHALCSRLWCSHTPLDKASGEGLHEFGALNTLLFVRSQLQSFRVSIALSWLRLTLRPPNRPGGHPRTLHRVRIPDQRVPVLLLARVWRRDARGAHCRCLVRVVPLSRWRWSQEPRERSKALIPVCSRVTTLALLSLSFYAAHACSFRAGKRWSSCASTCVVLLFSR